MIGEGVFDEVILMPRDLREVIKRAMQLPRGKLFQVEGTVNTCKHPEVKHV